jgi:glutamate-1-semialdehyde 2,1-aminomutase
MAEPKEAGPSSGADWEDGEIDRELFERDLESFVPPRVFDAHAHLYELRHFGGAPPPACARGPASAGWEIYRSRTGQITPGRGVSALFFGFPDPATDVAEANAFVAREARLDLFSRAQMLVRPEMDPEFVRETVRREKFVGLKPYHVYAVSRPTFEAEIASYLPEAHVRIAHEEGLTITLHLVRSRAMSDPANQGAIRRYAERYPGARWILAHAARGFNVHHTARGIEALRGLRNVWCDTSAVTECGAFEAIVRAFGPDRLLYGSDFPISHLRGRCVTVGDSFLWLSAANTDFGAAYAEVRPTLVGIESLRALKLACLNLALTDSRVEDLFWGNAASLLGLPRG